MIGVGASVKIFGSKPGIVVATASKGKRLQVASGGRTFWANTKNVKEA